MSKPKIILMDNMVWDEVDNPSQIPLVDEDSKMAYLFRLKNRSYGPVYTTGHNRGLPPELYKTYSAFRVEVGYHPKDTPIKDNLLDMRYFKFKSNMELFTISPMIYSMFGANRFADQILGLDNEIVINKLADSANDKSEFEIINDTKNIFREYLDNSHITSPCQKMFKSDNRIYEFYRNKTFEEVDLKHAFIYPKTKYIWVPIPEAFCGYLLSENSFVMLSFIRSLRIRINLNVDVRIIEPSITDILRVCLYLPQIISFEHRFIAQDIQYNLQVQCFGGAYFGFDLNSNSPTNDFIIRNIFNLITNKDAK